MSRLAELLRSRRLPQVAVLALMSVGFAGCSADMQTRLSEASPIPLPRSLKPPVRCARPPSNAASCRNTPGRRRPPRRNSSPRPCRRPPSLRRTLIRPVRAGCREEGAGFRPTRRRPSPPIETTATVPPRSVAAARPAAQNGTTIIVGTSDTLDLLAKRYNVSAAAILQANGYKGPRVLSPGQQLIIPRQTAVAAPRRRSRRRPASRLPLRPRRRASISSIAAIR